MWACGRLPAYRPGYLPGPTCDFDRQEGEATLAGELLRFGTTLGLLTIAEGVESDVQHAALVELGCPLAQGFHYAGPLSKEQLSMLLRAQHVVFPERQTA